MYPFERKNKILARLQDTGQINIEMPLQNLHFTLLVMEELRSRVRKKVVGVLSRRPATFETHFDKRMKAAMKWTPGVERIQTTLYFHRPFFQHRIWPGKSSGANFAAWSF
jgi:hypothetical protein